ncbi:hypothetical protein CEXT_55101 [Caerostris extrusa]|uniref:Uncharacterized protein n=1 Tax=Caerostris extrusa TaxID=172846 RepID=A0AAV4R809_CAEEX|nr:hypothetical protein CEXT_55101 [Caerostris extrusa]
MCCMLELGITFGSLGQHLQTAKFPLFFYNVTCKVEVLRFPATWQDPMRVIYHGPDNTRSPSRYLFPLISGYQIRIYAPQFATRNLYLNRSHAKMSTKGLSAATDKSVKCSATDDETPNFEVQPIVKSRDT